MNRNEEVRAIDAQIRKIQDILSNLRREMCDPVLDETQIGDLKDMVDDMAADVDYALKQVIAISEALDAGQEA